MTVNQKFYRLALAAGLIAVGLHLYGIRFGWGAIAASFPWQLGLLFNRDALIQFFSTAHAQSTASSAALGTGLFILAHIVANAVGVPGTVLVVVGGAVYGLWWGALCSVIGATMGAVVAFWIARYWFHGWFQRRFAHSELLAKLNKTLCKDGLSCILLIRFSPISPFNVVNFALGLTPVSAKSYALGTLIGIIPGTLAYTWLGVTGAEAIGSGNWIPLLLCLSLLMLLSAMPLIIRRRA